MYLKRSEALGLAALRRALTRARVPAEAVGYLVSTTTTGLATPSLDALLHARAGFSARLKRNPLFGTGCASGAVALARAGEYLKANPKEVAVVLAVELCSLTFRHDDDSLANLVSCALFSDGAVAVVLAGSEHGARGRGPWVRASHSHLFPGSTGVMGWEFGDGGMKIVLTPEVPELARGKLRPVVDDFLRTQGLEVRDIRHWILHPGGLKVIEAYEQAFGIGPERTRLSRLGLARMGNISSASVLCLLGDTLRAGTAQSGDWGLVLALGPGFAAEMSLLQW